MILLYHKVHPEPLTEWWVTVDTFYRHMLDLQRYDVVFLDDYDPSNPRHAVITFDGVYHNVLEYAVPIMEAFGYPFELFVTGDYVGLDNAFDTSEPQAQFASLWELSAMVARGGRIQWHTRSHRRADDRLSLEEIAHELDVPGEIRSLDPKGCKWFAYPHGDFSAAAVELVKERFVGALSCIQGDDADRYRWNRHTVKEGVAVTDRTVSVIIPTYNYGRFLPEAIESALRQTRLADEILISDDASTDNSLEIAEFYRDEFPDRIRVNSNSENLGIVAHFNKAIPLTRGDYVCFLGADNRFRSDFLERTCLALDLHPEAAVAYTDFCLFGDRAEVVYADLRRQFDGVVRENALHVIRFPEYGDEAIALMNAGINCMHGSSMFRRAAWEKAGGYRPRSTAPEDYALFKQMLDDGWSAIRVPEPLLEYRQHSEEQDNIKFRSHLELHYYRKKLGKMREGWERREDELARLRIKLEDTDRKLKRSREELSAIKGRVSWHLAKPVRILEKWLKPRSR